MNVLGIADVLGLVSAGKLQPEVAVDVLSMCMPARRGVVRVAVALAADKLGATSEAKVSSP